MHKRPTQNPMCPSRGRHNTMRTTQNHLFMGSKQRAIVRLDRDFAHVFERLSHLCSRLFFRRLDHYAFILCYPDALAEKAGIKIVDYLAIFGFKLVEVKAVSLTRRQLWRLRLYEPRRHGKAEIRAREFIETASPSLCLIFRNPVKNRSRSASRRISELKGSTTPGLRDNSQLRSLLKVSSPYNKLLHTADSTGDFLRELTVLLGRREAFATLQRCLEYDQSACWRGHVHDPLSHKIEKHQSFVATSSGLLRLITQLTAFPETPQIVPPVAL
jgi:nucleoside diphosphate kinase